MKSLIAIGVCVACVAAALIFAVLYFQLSREHSRRFTRILHSKDRQWVLSGENHLFDITERTVDVAGLFGFADGIMKWAPVGGPNTRFVPTFIPAGRTRSITDDEYVLGVVNGGTATAYPLRVLVAHQVVNDQTQKPPVLAYYGGTGRTAAAWSAQLDGTELAFASSGYLCRNVDLLYDQEKESLFLPASGAFVAGARVGERLEGLPSAVMTLGQWRVLYPESRLMNENTGVAPVTYPRRPVLEAPVELKIRGKGTPMLDAWPDDTPVVAIADGWEKTVVPFPAARGGGKTQYAFELAGRAYTVHFDEEYTSAYVTDAEGRLAPSVRSLWQVYVANFPEARAAQLK